MVDRAPPDFSSSSRPSQQPPPSPSPSPSTSPSSPPSPSFSLSLSSTRLRPTSPFLQSNLPRVPPTSSIHHDFSAPDAVAALAAVQGSGLEMEPSSSGHRRRRSSLMNSLDSSVHAKSKRTHKSPVGGKGIQEETKLGAVGDEEPLSNSGGVELNPMSDDEGLQDDEETGLTAKDKQRRKRRRRRNTLLDQRIAGESRATAEVKKEATQSVVKKSLINVSLIGMWYLCSLSISLYNKWMFDPELLNFPFPLFTTCVHMIVQFCLSSLVLLLLPQFRPRHDSISNPENTHSDADRLLQGEESSKPLMTKMFYLTRIGPCGLATGLDIGLGNMSLKLITLTFYTMCKSSSLAFVLMFAFAFRLETLSWRLVAIIATMTGGVVMMVAGEVKFSRLGFILVISAAFFSGFRWGLTQILLLRNPATSNPFSSIFFLAPVMFLSLLILAIPVEGLPALWQGLIELVEKKGTFLGPAVLLFPGMIAFCMTAAEFALLQRTSVVTLSIAGIFKEVVTISAAGIVFGDKLTPVNISGLFVTIGTIAAYNWIKIRKMRDDALNEAQKNRLDTDDHDSASDADGESEEEEDWGRRDDNYITMDGDILPGPSRSEPRSAATPSSQGDSLLHPNRAQMEALAASKRELSD